MQGIKDSRWMPFLYRSSGWRLEVVTRTTPWDWRNWRSLAEMLVQATRGSTSNDEMKIYLRKIMASATSVH